MVIDYNKKMKLVLKEMPNGAKLLLHVCCAPCSSAVIGRLTKFDITLFYNNSNIFPELEFDKRFLQFNKLTDLPIVKCDYDHEEFLKIVKGNEQDIEGGVRCEKCIEYRMRKTFEYAKTHGFQFVTTTLSISPHKNAKFINGCGEQLEREFGVKFLYADFKKENGFLNSISISKSLDLYRQDYCGCEFSINKR